MAEVPIPTEEGLLKPGALLHTMRLQNVQRKPLMMEFPVPQSPPFLVTMTRPLKLAWIPQARQGRVRAAVQDLPSTGDLFAVVIQETMAAGVSAGWGNVHPLTEEGIKAAIAHPTYYELENLQLLAHPQFNWTGINPEWKVKDGNTVAVVLKLPVEPAPWLDLDTIVVVPRDRSFVGFVIEIGEEHGIAVIHNASRAIGIATRRPEAEAGPVAG